MTQTTTPVETIDVQLHHLARVMLDLAAVHEENPTPESVWELTRQLRAHAASMQFIAGDLAKHYTRLASAPGDAIVRWTESGLTAYNEARQMIGDAHLYAENADTEEDLHDRRRAAVSMEQSFFYSLGHVITTSQHHDGPVIISRDGPGSLYWSHPKSGYHGGLIFHQSRRFETVKIGSWSIHT